jgi:hypothetical protein
MFTALRYEALSAQHMLTKIHTSLQKGDEEYKTVFFAATAVLSTVCHASGRQSSNSTKHKPHGIR